MKKPKVDVAHVRDGHVVEFDIEQFRHSEDELVDFIQSFLSMGLDVKVGDSIPCPDKDEEDDAVFYVINHRQLYLDDDKNPRIIYWVDDLYKSNLFPEL